ncbi:MAG: hypothetical protein SGILL_006516 [Bacillariaceae sp.]
MADDDKPPGPPPGQDEEASTKDITDPRETDVLCGRGGAALRHPGNQTYRRLVNLNKGLYITCLKTEKLKISRSIVAAIREQKGRFLEREAKKGTWYDIGDKKAIEKTSQALREGQPKLRAKMVEMGQIPPDQPVNPVQQQLGNGVYAPRHTPSLGSIGSMGAGSLGSFSVANPYGMHSHMNSMASTGSGNGMAAMPPPPSRTLSNNMNDEMAMLQRLSLTPSVPQSIPSWTPSVNSMGAGNLEEAQYLSARNRMRMNSNRSNFSNTDVMAGMGIQQSNMSMMSDISAIANGMSDRQMQQMQSMMSYPDAERIGSMDPSMTPQSMRRMQLQQQQQQRSQQAALAAHAENPVSPMGMPSPQTKDGSPSMANGNRFDRRRFFAKMKHARPPSRNTGQSQRSINDGMPDIHMVDSQFSLLSNLSGHGSKHHTMDFSAHGETKENSKDATIGSEYIGVGSRRSLMSGLSKMSGHSDHLNPFADMSKKLGATNHSVRSIAMSEISGIEEEGDFAEDDMDEFSFDLPVAKTPA